MPYGSACKNFWKFCKAVLTNKTTNFDNKLMFVEKKKVVSKTKNVSHFNKDRNETTIGLDIRNGCR